jgi:hypothetical protein
MRVVTARASPGEKRLMMPPGATWGMRVLIADLPGPTPSSPAALNLLDLAKTW